MSDHFMTSRSKELIVIVFSFHCPYRLDIALFRIYCIIVQIRQNVLQVHHIFCLYQHQYCLYTPQVKTLVKFRSPPRKTSISWSFFINWQMFPIKIAQYCGNLNKVVGATLFNKDYPILWYLKQSCWTNHGNLPLFSFLRR